MIRIEPVPGRMVPEALQFIAGGTRRDAFVESQIVKYDDKKWGNRLSSKLFVGREFVVKHVRSKHGHVVEAERERLLDNLFWENFRAAKEDEERRNGGGGGGAFGGGGRGGRGGGRGGGGRGGGMMMMPPPMMMGGGMGAPPGMVLVPMMLPTGGGGREGGGGMMHRGGGRGAARNRMRGLYSGNRTTESA